MIMIMIKKQDYDQKLKIFMKYYNIHEIKSIKKHDHDHDQKASFHVPTNEIFSFAISLNKYVSSKIVLLL